LAKKYFYGMRGYNLDPFQAHKWYVAVIEEARGTSYEADQQVMHAWTMLGYLYWRVFPQLKAVGHIDGYSYPAALHKQQQLQFKQAGGRNIADGDPEENEFAIDLSSSYLDLGKAAGVVESFWTGEADGRDSSDVMDASDDVTPGSYNTMEESLLQWDTQTLLDKAVLLFEECIAAGNRAEKASEAAAAKEAEEDAAGEVADADALQKSQDAAERRRTRQVRRMKSFSKISAGHLGFIYWRGESVETPSGVVLATIPVNRTKAIDFLRMSAERGNTWSNLHMAMVHEEEAYELTAELNRRQQRRKTQPYSIPSVVLKEQIDEHMEQALACFRNAARGSVLPAHDHMGRLYSEGDLIPRDCKKAIASYERVAEEQDELQDSVELGRKFFLDGDLNTAIALYSIAAESGHVTAQVNAAFLLLDSSSDDTAVEAAAAAFRYRWMAAEQGDKESQLHLGDYYYHGGFFGGKGTAHLIDSKQVDYATAEHWYTKAASREGRRPVRDSSESRSYAQALYNLAMMHK
jgi:TPR repeat protein